MFCRNCFLASLIAGAIAFSWSALAAANVPLAVQRVASGLTRPLFVTAPSGDTNRLFILEQHTGQIKILNLTNGTVNPTSFLRVTNLTAGDEQGLLGLAFDPQYATNGFLYLNYTTTGGGAAGHTEITRFTASGDPATADVADPASKQVLLTYDQPEPNHNGGWLGFGLDGFLYLSTGDGGGANDRHGTSGNGQNRNVLLGKILRIDVSKTMPYSIPETNPFKGDTTKKEEIWAFGLRNPWRCSIDRATGDLWIGDVGQDTREEIDFAPHGAGGLNFGWRPREGSIQNPAYDGSPNPQENPVTSATEPIYDYGHNQGVSVIGGYVYRGQNIPGLQGAYIFADYGSARFWSLSYDGSKTNDFQERTTELNPGKRIQGISSFGEDGIGELYFCDLAHGEIYKIIPTPLILSQIGIQDNEFNFSFNAGAGQTFTIESRDSLASGSWQSLTNITASAGTTLRFSNPISSSERYFRVRSP